MPMSLVRQEVADVTIKVTPRTQTWVIRPADPDDPRDIGAEDGHTVGVDAEVSTDEATQNPFFGRGGLPAVFDCDAVQGEIVYVVVADFSSTSTFGTRAGFCNVLAVFRSYENAVGLANAAERTQGVEFMYQNRRYYSPWTGTLETLKRVRVWDCYLDIDLGGAPNQATGNK